MGGGRGRGQQGLVISGSEGPWRRHLPTRVSGDGFVRVRRARRELPPRGLHVLGVTLLPPRTPLSHSCVGPNHPWCQGKPRGHRSTEAAALRKGDPGAGIPGRRPWGIDATGSLQRPDLPLGAPSCGQLTVTVGCWSSSPEGQDVLEKSCTALPGCQHTIKNEQDQQSPCHLTHHPAPPPGCVLTHAPSSCPRDQSPLAVVSPGHLTQDHTIQEHSNPLISRDGGTNFCHQTI